MQFSDAVRLYPYYSGYWRQMGDTKVRMAKEGSKADYDGFRKWWKLNHPDQELKQWLRWGGIIDLTVARALAPFLASDLVDIGYGIAMAEEFTEALLCYDQALALYSGETTRAYLHFRRAEAKERIGDTQDALSDYRESKELNETALEKQKTGRVIYVGLPYSLESMVADITQRIQRLESK
jgi:tetratricopeptide (TPR) repeat protein